MDITQDSDKKFLNTAGLRSTSQRTLILEIIRHGKGHLDADEVFRRARNKQPRISLSTVYRTIQKLKQMGLIEELHFDETHHHYEIKPPEEHHHFVCLRCGRVIEFQYPLSSVIKKEVPEARDFEIVDTEIHIAGYCSECRQGRE